MSKITPVGGRVIVEKEPRDEATKSGIFLGTSPTSPKKKYFPVFGKVIAANKTYRPKECKGAEVECPVKKGDRVAYLEFVGSNVEGGDLAVVLIEDIIAIEE